MQAGICRENFESGEVDQAVRSQIEMELVQNARERCSQGRRRRISVDLRVMGWGEINTPLGEDRKELGLHRAQRVSSL